MDTCWQYADDGPKLIGDFDDRADGSGIGVEAIAPELITDDSYISLDITGANQAADLACTPSVEKSSGKTSVRSVMRVPSGAVTGRTMAL